MRNAVKSLDILATSLNLHNYFDPNKIIILLDLTKFLDT